MQCVVLGLSPISLDLQRIVPQLLTAQLSFRCTARNEYESPLDCYASNDPSLSDTRHVDEDIPLVVTDPESDEVNQVMLVSIEARTNNKNGPQEFAAAVKAWLKQQGVVNVFVEIWASAACPLPLRPGHGYPFALEAAPSSLADKTDQVTMMKKWGMYVQRGAWEPNYLETVWRPMIDMARTAAEAALQQQHPTLVVGLDAFSFKEMASRSTQRFDLRLTDSAVNEEVCTKIFPVVRNNVREWLGLEEDSCQDAEVDWDISVVYSKPGAQTQGWHADGCHKEGASDAEWSKQGWQTKLTRPYAVCMFLPLIDLNEEVGYTQFWPGSHRHRGLMGLGPVAEVTTSVWNGSVKMGDAIWYDYRLWHRGMPNHSSGTLRPVVQIIFKLSSYVERANYGNISIYAGS